MQLTLEQKQFILTHAHEEVLETALRFVRPDMSLLLAQIAGRKMAEKKIPSWYEEEDIIYPPHLSLEQSSSELTARYKASLLASTSTSISAFPSSICYDPIVGITTGSRISIDGGNATFFDLTGGMGVDFSFVAPYFEKAVYVEQNKELCAIAVHNFGVLELSHVKVHCGSAESFLKETSSLDVVYLDPSRRDGDGRKVFRIEDCSPDLMALKPLLLQKSENVMVKYSPMLDITLAVKSLGCVKEVHVVSVENECKELLFLLSNKEDAIGTVSEPQFVTVNLKRSGRSERFSFTMLREQNSATAFAEAPQKYLYEPNASILKAGAFKSVAEEYHLQKLHVNSHLYTSEELIVDFPGRVFEVKDFFVANKKNSKTFLQTTKKANVTVRNFPMTVAEIRRRTGLEDGGDIYLFATTLSDERKVWVVCEKI